MRMFVVSFRNVCLCVVLQLVTGKSLDLQYGYQEIEDAFSQTDKEEVKNLEFDRLSDDAIEEICKHFKVTIRIKEPESVINCLEPPFDGGRSVILIKRDVADLEGSGDTDTPVQETTPDQKNEESHTDTVQSTSENATETNLTLPEVKVSASSESKVEVPPEDSKPIEQSLLSSEKPEIPTDNPGSFQGGFDHILKNIPRHQNESAKNIDDTDIILMAPASNGQVNNKPDVSSDGEEAKTGESQEKPTAASPNNMLLIVIGALGIIGALAFVYNFVKSKRESREIDEVMRLETEGKELKEMKPLMKGPLAQNGAKSMEYIDADPQIQVPTETRVEVTRDHNSE